MLSFSKEDLVCFINTSSPKEEIPRSLLAFCFLFVISKIGWYCYLSTEQMLFDPLYQLLERKSRKAFGPYAK